MLVSEAVINADADIVSAFLWRNEVEIQGVAIVVWSVPKAKCESISAAKVGTAAWHDVVAQPYGDSEAVCLIAVLKPEAGRRLGISVEDLAAFTGEEVLDLKSVDDEVSASTHSVLSKGHATQQPSWYAIVKILGFRVAIQVDLAAVAESKTDVGVVLGNDLEAGDEAQTIACLIQVGIDEQVVATIS